jgi:hypothetical protein
MSDQLPIDDGKSKPRRDVSHPRQVVVWRPAASPHLSGHDTLDRRRQLIDRFGFDVEMPS